MFGLERTLGTRLVTYADDLVILCRRGKAEEALQRLREIMGKLKLTVNEEGPGSAKRRKESSTSWDTHSGNVFSDPHVRLCVQRRLACSAGERPAGARIRGPVMSIGPQILDADPPSQGVTFRL